MTRSSMEPSLSLLRLYTLVPSTFDLRGRDGRAGDVDEGVHGDCFKVHERCRHSGVSVQNRLGALTVWSVLRHMCRRHWLNCKRPSALTVARWRAGLRSVRWKSVRRHRARRALVGSDVAVSAPSPRTALANVKRQASAVSRPSRRCMECAKHSAQSPAFTLPRLLVAGRGD